MDSISRAAGRSRWGACIGLLATLFLVGHVGHVAAQGVEETLVITCAPSLARLGTSVVETLNRRGRAATLDISGTSDTALIPEAAAAGSVTLWPLGDGLEVRLIGPEGRDRAVALEALDARDPVSARVVVMALEALFDAPLPNAVPVQSFDPDAPAYVLRHSDYAPGGAHFGRTEAPPGALPMVILRFMLGYSPATGGLLVGPGAGLGVCSRGHCLLLEAGLSLLPEDRLSNGQTYRFRSVDTGLRVLFRLWEHGRFGAGCGLGVLSRVGEAFSLGTNERRVVSDLGVRSTLEISARVAGPFELVLESGVDFAVTRAVFLRAGQRVFLEDRARPWLVFGIRIRPRFGLEN